MSSKLKVDELRSQLSLRGLDTAGSKPILVKRLESAILEDEEAEKKKNDATATKKRPREEKEEDANGGVSLEELEEMGVRELRALAKSRGLAANGSKRDLVERIFEAANSDSEVITDVKKRDMGDCNGAKVVEATEKLQDMGIQQLRELAKARGVKANGLKKELIERLSAGQDLDSQTTIVVKDAAEKSGECEDEKVVQAIEKLQDMGIHQLRELAKAHGIKGNGSKKELIERLSADQCLDSQKTIAVNDAAESKEKLVKTTKKGRAVLDPWLPDHIKSSFHVLEMGEVIYDAMLNQTNVGDNNNKFYLMQVLESDDGGKFLVYNRWGRVGVRGQDKLHGPYTSQDRAIDEFSMKFFDKTKNNWSERWSFKCYPKKYTWLEMDYDESEKAPEKKVSVEKQLRETKLEPRIAKFVSLICNISMMKQQMLEIGYNAEKLPLGKLSKSTISKGYDVLRRISEVISRSDRKLLEQLSGEFYTVIPHDFGFKKMREFIIDTPYKLKCKLEMVATLGEIEIATKILSDDAETGDDPMYSRYQHLRCELSPVEADSREFSMIKKYMLNTHAKTHSSYTVDVAQIFKVFRNDEPERFSKFTNVKNRMLLWHGSRLTNWTGILSQGLRIAPPEAPVTGYMFGKGVYFADMFSKSANYCFATKDCSTGVLLLCEVALGDMSERLAADYHADRLPEGKLSTKGVGATAPDMSESEVLEDGVVIPLGKPKEQNGTRGSLQYNEYIVYNVDQIRMRYIVQVNFRWK